MKPENNEPEEQTFDIDAMPVTNQLQDLHQEGNFLVGLTDLGVRFRQRIPADKILTKEGGEFKLKTREVAQGSHTNP